MPPLSLYFLMWLQNLSQTREPAVACANPALDACNEPIGSDGKEPVIACANPVLDACNEPIGSNGMMI
jgi:hypothetical protein